MDASVREEVRRYAMALGFDLVGFAGAEPFQQEESILWGRQAEGYRSPFEEPDIHRRVHPQELLPGAATIVAVAVSFSGGAGAVPPDDIPRGSISLHARGPDYHRILGEGLEALAVHLRELFPGAHARAFVDTGPPLDRAVAARAGLGWFGKNCSIITPFFGSLVYLGEVLTDVHLPPDDPLQGGCGACTRCIDACPTGALEEPYVTNRNVCFSYITQRRGFMEERFREALGNRLYGCDTCQNVCPFNIRFLARVGASEEGFPPLEEILGMDNRAFEDTLGKTSAGWRGRTTFQRNAVVALGNSGDPRAVEILARHLTDPRPVIRAHAAWALGKLGGSWAVELLQGTVANEGDEAVLAEVRRALERCG